MWRQDGGDEFFLILPVTPKKGASVLADHIRWKIREKEIFFNGVALRATASIGIATFPSAGVTDIDSLIKSADQVLYEAKSRGRDKAVAGGAETGSSKL